MKYIVKQIKKQLFENVSYLLVLFLLAFLTSGMFFFVRFSIDKNEQRITEYIENQKQESFRFSVNVLSDKAKVEEIRNRYNLDESEISRYGIETVIHNSKIDLADLNDMLAEELGKQYQFAFVKRDIKTVEESDRKFYLLNETKGINESYVLNGKLPTERNGIALLSQFMKLNNYKVNDQITIGGETYTITGEVYLPDYLAFIPFGQLQQEYNVASFAIVTKEQLEMIAGNEVIYYCGKVDKDVTALISDMEKDERVSYVEAAAQINSDSLPQMGFDSNKSLAFTFLFGLLFVSAFVYYMFYKKYIYMNRKQMGCMKALGFTTRKICRAMIQSTVPFTLIGSILGCIVGGKLSIVLVNRYIEDYSFNNFGCGVTIIMMLIGILALPILNVVLICITCSFIAKEDAAQLMRADDKFNVKGFYFKFVNKLSGLVKEKKKFSFKAIMRKKINLLLSVITMLAVLTLFVMSISLYLSSTKVYKDSFVNHNYQYRFTSNYYVDDTIDVNGDALLKTSCVISTKSKRVVTNLYGMDEGVKLWKLQNTKGEIIQPKEDKVIISKGFGVLYGLEKGDMLLVQYNGNSYECEIQDLCANGNVDDVYMNKSVLAGNLQVAEDVANLFLEKEKAESLSDFNCVSIEEEKEAARANQSSNKASAVINQVIGILFGMVMFYLVLLITLQECERDIMILHHLGYDYKRTFTMVLGSYRAMFITFFILTYVPAMYICSLIHKNISMSTNDYIPFTTSMWVVVAAFLVVQIIYSIVVFIFKNKIKKLLYNM